MRGFPLLSGLPELITSKGWLTLEILGFILKIQIFTYEWIWNYLVKILPSTVYKAYISINRLILNSTSFFSNCPTPGNTSFKKSVRSALKAKTLPKAQLQIGTEILLSPCLILGITKKLLQRQEFQRCIACQPLNQSTHIPASWWRHLLMSMALSKAIEAWIT